MDFEGSVVTVDLSDTDPRDLAESSPLDRETMDLIFTWVIPKPSYNWYLLLGAQH